MGRAGGHFTPGFLLKGLTNIGSWLVSNAGRFMCVHVESGMLFTRLRHPVALPAFVLAVLSGACGTNEARTSSNNPDLVGGDAGGDGTTLPDGGAIDPDAGDADASASDGSGADGVDGDGGTDLDGGSPDGGSVEGGSACTTDADCPEGLRCDGDFGPPFCAPIPTPDGSNCATSADCEFADSDQLFCCAGYFGSQRCAPAGDPATGATCGDSTGEQGDDCVDGGQSDCAGERAVCLFSESDYAYCSEACVAPAFACAEGAYCRVLVEGPRGYGLCIEYGDTEDLTSCIDDPTACGENSFCILGEEGDPLAFCATVCESDADCSGDTVCNDFGVCTPDGGREPGESCIDDRFSCGDGGFCINYGTRYAQCTQRCERDRDCSNDSTCFITETGEGFCIREGDRAQGEFCGDDPLSCEGICSGDALAYDPGAFCINPCESDADCPGTSYCTPVGPAAELYCQPDGSVGQGGDCSLDPFSCERGSICVGYGTGDAFCSRPCAGDAECGAGNWCIPFSSEVGYCVPAGEASVGEECTADRFSCGPELVCGGPDRPQCFQICTDDPTGCPSGQTCLDPAENGERYCLPTGDREYGSPCADDIYSCALPSFCAETFSEQARCTVSCTRDGECPAGEWCYATATGGVCRPGGTAGPMESCEGDLYACRPGLTCLLGGGPGAFCAEECTGFPSVCGDGEACTWVGYGRSVCIATGGASHGESCAEDRFACDDETWCASAGTESATCVDACSFSPDECPDGTSCRFLRSGLALCLGAGLSPDDPLNPGGTPL